MTSENHPPQAASPDCPLCRYGLGAQPGQACPHTPDQVRQALDTALGALSRMAWEEMYPPVAAEARHALEQIERAVTRP